MNKNYDFLKRIIRKVSNILFFRKKLFHTRKSQKMWGNYFDKREQLLDQFVKQIPDEYNDYSHVNSDLSTLLHIFFKSNNFTLSDLSKMIAGKIIYNRTGITPDGFQQLLIKAYCRSNGLFQDIFHEFMYKDYQAKIDSSNVKSEIFGEVTIIELEEIIDKIKNEGYVILPKKVSQEKVNRIKKWAKSIKYDVVDYDDKRHLIDNLDFSNPGCVTANALEEDLEKNNDILSLIYDPVIIAIISKYLGMEKLSLIHLCMWWTFKSEKDFASSEAAQLYHYDLDHIKWLKVFFYLTDVGEEQGPHVYIPSSHIAGNKNYKLLEKNYGRVKDSEMDAIQNVKPKKVLGSAGSIIIGDTKCYHKGTPVVSGARLVLQPTFGPSNLLKNIKN